MKRPAATVQGATAAAQNADRRLERPHATTRQLRCLVALAREGDFTRTAKRLGVSKPSLSGQISGLERATGEKLVERGSSALLTAAGRAVLEKSQGVLLMLREIEMIHESGGPSGTLRLGTCPTIGPYLLPAAISGLHRDHPAMRVYVREDTPAALACGLAHGEYDLLLAPVPACSSRFEVEFILRERLFVAVAADDPLADLGEIDVARLHGRPLLAFPAGHGMEPCLAAVAEYGGAMVSWEGEDASLHAIGQMAAAGMGLAILPEMFVRRAARRCAGIIARPLRGFAHGRDIAIAWRRGTANTRLNGELVKRLRAEATGN